MKKTFLNRFVQICIVLGMLAGAALIVLLIVKYPAAAETLGLAGVPKIRSAIAASVAAVCVLGGEYIAFELLCMMRTLERDPFVQGNVRSLHRMGAAALIVAALGTAATLMLHPLRYAAFAALPVAMCGLFSLVLSGVFEQAVAYKQENDLTI